jgi:hypothetical protein
MPGFASEQYLPSLAYISAHIEKGQGFRRVSAKFTRLADWVGLSGILPFFSFDSGASPPIRIDYSHPDEITADTQRGSVKICFAAQTRGDPLRELSLQQSVSVELIPRQPLDVEELHKQLVWPFQNLLTFATGRANSIVSLTLFSPEHTFKLNAGRTRETPVEVFFKTRVSNDLIKKRLLKPDMLFTFQDIEERFEEFIAAWFGMHSEIEDALELFFSLQYIQKRHLTRDFLALCQGVESFHRHFYSNRKLPKSEFRRRKRLVLENCPEDCKAWLEDALVYYNEPHLKDRLRELVDSVAETVLPLVGNRDTFIEKVKNTRNYLTHHVLHLENEAAHGEELFDLTTAVSYLFSSCLLSRLNFGTAQRVDIYCQNQSYLFALRKAPLTLAKIFFGAATRKERNKRIAKAHLSHGFLQKDIARFHDLHPATVSRIISRYRP